MSIAVVAMDSLFEPVLKVLGKEQQPSLGDGEPGDVDDEEVPDRNTYSLQLESELFQNTELVVDFSSLKSCLDPQRDPADNQNTNDGNVHPDFDYRSFIEDTFDKKADQFSSLQTLVIRKVSMVSPTDSLDKWDQYTHLYHSILQLSGLSELDLSNNQIHTELQDSLQVRRYT